MDRIFTTITLAIFTTSMLGLLVKGRRIVLSYNFTSKILVNVVFFFAIYKVAGYYGVPLILECISNFQYVREDGVRLNSLAILYLVETISWIAWLAGIVCIAALKRRKRNGISKFAIFAQREIFAKWLIVVFAFGYAYFRILSFVGFASGDFTVPWYFEITKSLLSYVGPPASLVLIVVGYQRWGFLFSILGIVSFVLGFSTISSRGALVYPILFLGFLLVNYVKSRKAYLAFITFFAIILAIYFILGGLPSLAVSLRDDQSVNIEIPDIAAKKGERSSIEEIEWRFGAAARMSTKFIEMYDRGAEAGINPIMNSLLGFLPRSVSPNKPYPSTLDGNDFFSQGMYLIYRETHGYDTGAMVEFSTGGHAYWEFGWIGVVILSAISGVYIGLCLQFFQRLGLFSLPLLVGTFKPWGYVDPKMWVSDIAMQLYQLIFPLIGIILIMYIITSLKVLLGGKHLRIFPNAQ